MPHPANQSTSALTRLTVSVDDATRMAGVGWTKLYEAPITPMPRSPASAGKARCASVEVGQ